MIRILFVLAAAGLALAAASAQEVAVETPDVLPAGLGRDEAFYVCTACHGSAIVRQQGMTRDLWEQTIDIMIQRQQMAPLEAPLRALIADYLAASFPPRRRAPANPFVP